MNKIKFLYILIVLLVTTNIGVLLTMYIHKPPHHLESPREIIVEKLGFDNKQEKAYEVIIKNHRASIKEIEQKIRTNKDALFSLLKTEDSVKKDSIISNLGGLQMEIETAHYTHFEAIKSICNDDQLDRFDNLTKELGRLFAPPGMPKKPRNK